MIERDRLHSLFYSSLFYRCSTGALLVTMLFVVSIALDSTVIPVLSAPTLAFASDPPAKPAQGAKKKTKKKKKKTKRAAPAYEEKPSVIGEGSYGNAQFDRELNKPNTIDAVLLIDSSGSMQRTDPDRLRDQAAKLFMRFLGDGDRVAVYHFDQETKQVQPFTEITPVAVAEIDKRFDEIAPEGRFTNLEMPVREALRVLLQDGRAGSIKAVVLLSDGQMDPSPDAGTRQELINRLMQTSLPEFRLSGIRLYTVAMSPESDRELLQRMAERTDGLSWYAPDVESIHMKFSDLFLALKKPQVAPLEGGGFEIDPTVKEATFYINRQGVEREIALITPMGEPYTSESFPPTVKWYRGQLFDVVTVTSPLSGQWKVRGVENPAGFATLVTNLQVQVRWPQSNLKIGDSVAFFARLVADGKPFDEPGVRDITFYQYKLISSRRGEVLTSGPMNDDGKDGDEKAKDGVYSATVKVDEDGEFRAFVGVTSPTFTRQQQIPFVVSRGLVQLELETGNQFLQQPDVLKISLGKETEELEGIEVRLLVERQGESKLIGIKPDKTKEPLVYRVAVIKLPVGELKLSAKVTGKDKKTKKARSGVSESIPYTVNPGAGKDEKEAPEAGEVIDLAEDEERAEPVDTSWIPGLVGVIVALIWSAALIFYVKKKLDFEKGLPEREARYEPDAELAKELAALAAKVSNRRRIPTPEDYVVFELARAALDEAAEAAKLAQAAEVQEESDAVAE